MPPLNELRTNTKPELGLKGNFIDASEKKNIYAKQNTVVGADKVFELVKLRLLEEAGKERLYQQSLALCRAEQEVQTTLRQYRSRFEKKNCDSKERC